MERSSRVRWVAGLEVVAAAAVTLLDLFLPALVLTAMAGVSLAARREPPSSLGFHRPEHPGRLALSMLGVALVLTALHVTLLDPVVAHLTGEEQDTSGFADLEGDVVLLVVYVVLSWTLAAVVEETAFRGYLLTRASQALGGDRLGVGLAIGVSALLFGLVHTEQGTVGVVLATVDGLVFGVLRVVSGTLWAPVLVHGFGNTIGFVAFFLAGPVGPLW